MDKKSVLKMKIWKEKPFCILSALVCLLLLFCVVKIIMPRYGYLYEGSCSFTEGVSENNKVIYSGIKLKPGVYRVELEYAAEVDLASICRVWDGTVSTGALLSNGEHLYNGLDRTGYDFWLYEETDNLQVTIEYSGRGSLATGSLKIIETKQMWTMLLTMGLFVWLLGCGILIFRHYDKAGKISADKKKVFFGVMLIGFVASVPYLCGYNITGADLTYHLQRIEGVKDGLLGGQFPVRLEPRWVCDHGYANAIFYCNTFLYFPAILRLLGFSVVTSYNMYCIVLNLATAWISYYCFGRMFKRQNIGIICSALYTLSIFRIYKLIITSATGEGTAVTFIPLVLYGMYRIYTEDPESKEYKTAWVPVMLGMSGLIQSHVLTCEVTAGVLFLFCVAEIRKTFRKKTFWALTKAALSSLLVSLWFLVPFVDYYLTQDVHIKHVSARTIQEMGLYFAQLAFHYWKTGSNAPGTEGGMQHSHPVGIGLILIVGLGIFLIMWYAGVFRKSSEKNVRFTKRVAVIGILLLYMSLNIFPWDWIQNLNSVTAALVSSLQFPNRFLGWGTGCLVLVFGFCLWHFENHDKKYYWIMTAAAIFGITTSSMYLLDYVNADQNYFEIYNEEGMGFGYISGAEYLIEGTDKENLMFARPVLGAGVEMSNYEKKYTRTEFQCVNSGNDDSYVDLPVLLYKGYQATDVSTGQRLNLCPGENNVIRVLLPAGFAGHVKVSFVSPVYWRISEVVSMLTAIVLLFRVIFQGHFLKGRIVKSQ